MIAISKVTQMSGEDGNSIIVSQQVELTEEDAMTYIQIDELLRKHHNNKEVLDCVSDYGFTYVDDTLVTIYWDRLNDLLTALVYIIDLVPFIQSI